MRVSSKLYSTIQTPKSKQNDIAEEIETPKDEERLSFGVAEIFRNIPLNEQFDAFRAIPSTSEKYNFTIEKVGHSPHVFILRNVLTPQECENIKHEAIQDEDGMAVGETGIENDFSSRKNSFVTWLDYDDNADSGDDDIHTLVDSIAVSVGYLLLDKSTILDKYIVDAEKLQIVKYTKDGEYVLHHDGNGRILTCLYYLNGIAGTWFPFVNNELHHPSNREEAIRYAKNYTPGTHGLLIASSSSRMDAINDQETIHNKNIVYVNPGDAVAFFNLETDEDGIDENDVTLNVRNDWRTIHAGLPNTNYDEKWIATHWFHADDEDQHL